MELSWLQLVLLALLGEGKLWAPVLPAAYKHTDRVVCSGLELPQKPFIAE